jgi:hypothetical protein
MVLTVPSSPKVPDYDLWFYKSKVLKFDVPAPEPLRSRNLVRSPPLRAAVRDPEDGQIQLRRACNSGFHYEPDTKVRLFLAFPLEFRLKTWVAPIFPRKPSSTENQFTFI